MAWAANRPSLVTTCTLNRDSQRRRQGQGAVRNLDWFEVTEIRGHLDEGDLA